MTTLERIAEEFSDGDLALLWPRLRRGAFVVLKADGTSVLVFL